MQESYREKEAEPYRQPYQSGEKGGALPSAGDEYLETERSKARS